MRSRCRRASFDQPPLARRLLAELLGTALLVTVVVGSGIAAQRLSPSDVGLQLWRTPPPPVLGLTVLILLFGPVSGAHFNPVVSLADWLLGRRTGRGCPSATSGATRPHRSSARSPAPCSPTSCSRWHFEVSTTDRAPAGPPARPRSSPRPSSSR